MATYISVARKARLNRTISASRQACGEKNREGVDDVAANVVEEFES